MTNNRREFLKLIRNSSAALFLPTQIFASFPIINPNDMNNNNAIVYFDASEIVEGKKDELKRAINELVHFINVNESKIYAYHIYLDEKDSRMTVFQIHPDSASFEFHMEVAGKEFAKLKDLIKLSTIDIYGKASDKLINQLNQKALMLGGKSVVAHNLQAGFTRFNNK